MSASAPARTSARDAGPTSGRPLRPSPGATVLAMVAGLASLGVVVLDIVTSQVQRGYLHAAPGYPDAVIAVSVAVLGGWLLAARPGHRVGWLLVATGALWGLDALANAWAAFALRPDEVLPGAAAGIWFFDRVGALLALPMPLLLLVYPHGRLAPGRLGRVGAVALCLGLVLPAFLLVAPASVADRGYDLPAPARHMYLDFLTLPVPDDVARGVLVCASVLLVGLYLVALTTVLAQLRAARGTDRLRYGWLLWAAVVDVAVVTFSLLVKGSGVTVVGLVVAMLVTAGSVTVGILRPTLLDIDRLLSATVVYAGLSVLFVGIDLSALALGGAVLGDRLAERDVTVVVLLAAALLYGPLREWLRRGVRRLVVGERDDPYAVVAGLASRLELSETPEQQLAEVTETVTRAFGVRFVHVEVVRPSGERLVVTHGVRTGPERELPITFRSDLVGRLVLPRLGPGARLSARDQALLADVVRQAAVAARSSQLADQLQDSREALVSAREEERRRIRRDLHDGLGPALGSVVLRIDHARNLLAPVPDDADAALTQARDEVAAALADVRRLVHDLRPPALDDLGLLGALRQEARKLRGALDVDVHAEGLPDLPAAVEVATYRIVCEAMTNAVRHAGAARVDVRLGVQGGRLEVTVADDGTGIAATTPAGVGLVSMRERAAELGGAIEVTCPPGGGTLVRACVPLTGTTDRGGS